MTIFPAPLKCGANGSQPFAFSPLSLSAAYLTGLQTTSQSQSRLFPEKRKILSGHGETHFILGLTHVRKTAVQIPNQQDNLWPVLSWPRGFEGHDKQS